MLHQKPVTDSTEERPPPIPWRRVAGLLRPIWRGLGGMIALSTGGVLMGLVPPLALGVLINALVDRNDTAEAAALSGVIALAITLEASAYIISDGLYARSSSRLYRNLRLQMFAGASRRKAQGEEDVAGLSSRFISDAQSLQQITVSILDNGAMTLVEFGSAMIALGLLEPMTIPVAFPLLAATWVVTRRMQGPVAAAGNRRQVAIEAMTLSIAHELGNGGDAKAPSRFRVAAERLMAAEIRYGWLQAFNYQGSGGIAKLAPIAVVVGAAFAGMHHAGTLLAIYLLAQRAFWGFDGIVDMSLGTQSARGAVARCFDLIDTPDKPSEASPPLETAA